MATKAIARQLSRDIIVFLGRGRYLGDCHAPRTTALIGRHAGGVQRVQRGRGGGGRRRVAVRDEHRGEPARGDLDPQLGGDLRRNFRGHSGRRLDNF